ncbi:alpha/beta-hydrolase [Martensiomyces pterosporus]|nr:alpha/beta-hydrolase [Martensiomyces pterosporus]
MSFAKHIPLPQRVAWPVAGELRETLFWPCRGAKPGAVLLLVPGNPGLIDFYIDFAATVHKAHGDSMEIIGVSHLGHTRFSDNGGLVYRNPKVYSLEEQIAHMVAVFDTLDREYSQVSPRPKMLLCGHSVGCYISEKIVECRGDRIDRVFSLFPTVDHIADTPRGRQLQPMFLPGVRQVVAGATELLTWILPASALYAVAGSSSSLNNDNARIVVDKMLHSSCVSNVLKMAADEMAAITDLDTELYGSLGNKFVMYYGAADHWVPQSRYERMKKANTKGRVVLCQSGIPHSFVTSHPKEMAVVLASLLRDEMDQA